MEILIPILVVGAMGIIFGILLGVASKIFEVKTDDRVPKIVETLPGANCGGCGFAGCNAYANAIVNGKAKPNLCPVGGQSAAEKISEILGVELEEKEKNVAFVTCRGTNENAKIKYIYDGLEDCYSAARLGGGEKMCSYACLGLGSCVKVCKFDALSIENGVAVVDPQKCVACGACVAECPKNVIKLVPESTKYTVSCNNPDKGKPVMSVCKVGCIGCGICAKSCPREAITLNNNLAEIDYSKCVSCGICAEKCPRKTINLLS